jgi:hypothetical protein
MDRGTHLDVLKAWGQDRSRTAQGFQRPSQPIRALGEAFPFIHCLSPGISHHQSAHPDSGWRKMP